MALTLPKHSLVVLPDFPEFFRTGSYNYVLRKAEEAMVPLFDRGLHFGDNLYEVVRTYDRHLFAWDEHLSRLRESARLAKFAQMIDTNLLLTKTLDVARATVALFGPCELYVRITVSRGLGDTNIDPSYASAPWFSVIARALPPYPDTLYKDGISTIVSETVRNHPRALTPAVKSGNYLNNILAIEEARKANADDAIIPNFQGFITEGTTNNIFMVTKTGEIFTPPESVGILHGITRRFLMDAAETQGILIREKLFTAVELRLAQEIFLTSTTKEIVPITRLDGTAVGNGKPGPTTQRLAKIYSDLVSSKKQSYPRF